MKTVKKMQMGGTMMSDSTMMKKGGTVKGKKPKMEKGGAMKDVPAGKKGLAKLPTEVRNKMGYKKNGGATGKAQAGTEIKKAPAPAAPASPERGMYKEGILSGGGRPKTQMDGKMGMTTYSAPKITKDTATAPPMKKMGGSMKYKMGGAMKAKMGGAMKTKKK
jgi:hypothetical protein